MVRADGQLVLVRDFYGKARLRRVWGYDERGVYVVTDRTLAALAARLDAPMPIGIPREDAFQADGVVTDGETPDWTRLQSWTPNEE